MKTIVGRGAPLRCPDKEVLGDESVEDIAFGSVIGYGDLHRQKWVPIMEIQIRGSKGEKKLLCEPKKRVIVTTWSRLGLREQ